MISEEALSNVIKGFSSYQTEELSMYHLIDLGIIQGYNDDGSVNVLALYLDTNKQPVTFERVEVLYPGTNTGAITYNAEGSLCLLLKMKVSIPNTQTMEIDTTASPYGSSCIKAIPVTRGSQTAMKSGFDGFGNFSIQGDGCNLNITKKGVTLSSGGSSVAFSVDTGLSKCLCNGQLFIDYNKDGSKRVLRYDTAGVAQYMLKVEADGSYTIKHNATKAFEDTDYDDLDAFTDWMWIEQYNVDGSRLTTLQKDADTPLLTREIAANGSVTDTLTKDSGMSYTLKVGEDVSITIDGSKKSIAFTTGEVTEERKDGGWSLQVNGPITIEGTGSDLVKIKNANSSFFDVINKILTVLNGGSCATQGSPAAHIIIAGQFTDALTALQQLTGA